MKHLLIVGLALCLWTGAANAADVTVGVDNSSNCVPFGCATSNNLSAYQQIYAGSQFGGPMSIGSVSFYKDSSAATNATLETLSFNLSFYTATTTIAGLTTNMAGNRGTLLADFGTFSLSGAMPDVLTFSAPSTFLYDPSAGNLLLQLTVLSNTAAGSGAFFQADSRIPSQGAVSRRVYTDSIYGTFTASNGLVTTFSSATAAAVPEPASWGLAILGLGMIGMTLRRRQTVRVGLV